MKMFKIFVSFVLSFVCLVSSAFAYADGEKYLAIIMLTLAVILTNQQE